MYEIIILTGMSDCLFFRTGPPDNQSTETADGAVAWNSIGL